MGKNGKNCESCCNPVNTCRHLLFSSFISFTSTFLNNNFVYMFRYIRGLWVKYDKVLLRFLSCSSYLPVHIMRNSCSSYLRVHIMRNFKGIHMNVPRLNWRCKNDWKVQVKSSIMHSKWFKWRIFLCLIEVAHNYSAQLRISNWRSTISSFHFPTFSTDRKLGGTDMNNIYKWCLQNWRFYDICLFDNYIIF